jgi:hypothetical protein
MATIKLSKEFMREDVLYGNKTNILRNEQIDNTRWSIVYELVFKHDGKLYRTEYSRGATEQQDERPWQYDDEVECTEVEAFEKTVTDYRLVSP